MATLQAGGPPQTRTGSRPEDMPGHAPRAKTAGAQKNKSSISSPLDATSQEDEGFTSPV